MGISGRRGWRRWGGGGRWRRQHSADSKHAVSQSKLKAEQVLMFGDKSKTEDAEFQFNVLMLYKILRLLFVQVYLDE